jgi:Lytic transglycolase
VRPPRVVAGAALIAVLASVAVSASGWSRTPSPSPSYDPDAFEAVRLDGLEGTVTTTPAMQDSALDSAGVLAPAAWLLEPPIPQPSAAPPNVVALPGNPPLVVSRTVSYGTVSGGWHHNPDESWYGPGFYGQHTACGQILTETLRGVANRTLPCGTLVTFRNPNNGLTITVPVVDRGPYVAGREWDLTHGTCDAINHCWTGPLDWRFP